MQQVGHDCHLQPGAELVHEPDGGRPDPLCGHADVGRHERGEHDAVRAQLQRGARAVRFQAAHAGTAGHERANARADGGQH